MNNLKWLGQTATVMGLQQDLLNNMQTCEITLIGCGLPVKAHRFMLSASSNLLRDILTDLPSDSECTIIVPGVRTIVLESIVSFIYRGEVNITSGELTEFLQTINILGIKSAISFECNVTSIASVMGISNHKSVISISAMDTSTMSTGTAPNVMETDTGAITSDQLTMECDEQNGKSSINGAINDNVINPEIPLLATTQEMDFLQFYPDAPIEKITYSIEKDPTCTLNALDMNGCIIAENIPQYALTTCPKLNDVPMSNVEQVNLDEIVESGIIVEEYVNNGDGLIQINAPNQNNITEQIIAGNSSITDFTMLKDNSKIETLFVNPLINNGMNDCINNINDCINSMNECNNIMNKCSIAINECYNEQMTDYEMENDGKGSPTDLAYHSIINDGLTIPKAANKFKISKSSLWRKVRNAGVKKYVEATDNQPAKEDINASIEDACKAVVREGLSLQKAAVKYDVSKTVLWRRVSKHPDYMKISRQNPAVSRACERLKMGESLKSISKDLDIPMSTLHRYKVRLLMSGQLPATVSCRRRDKLGKLKFQKNLEKAVHACIYKGISQNQAAHMYSISKSTLWRHLQKRVAEAEAAEAKSTSTTADSDHGQDETTDEDDLEEDTLIS